MGLVVLRGLAARKLRLLLTSLAIVIGAGFVTSSYVIGDSLRGSFDELFSEASDRYDVIVQGRAYVDVEEQASSGAATLVGVSLTTDGVPEEFAERLARLDGVQTAAGAVFEQGAVPLDAEDEPLVAQGPPSFAVSWNEAATDVTPFNIRRGGAPERGEVLVNERLFEDQRMRVGQPITVLLDNGRVKAAVRVVGTIGVGSADSLAGGAVVVFEQRQLQELLGAPGKLSALWVQGDGTVGAKELDRAVQRELAPGLVSRTADEFSEAQTRAIDEGFLRVIQYVVLGFSAVAVFVAAFLIFNTFSMLVAQRTREFGLLRVLGSTSRQLLVLVLAEALLVGLLASALGIAAGFGLAYAILSLLTLFAVEMPETLRIGTDGVVASFLVGTFVTLAAAVVPALRAARLTPIEALRDNPAVPRPRRRLVAAGAVLALGGMAVSSAGFLGAASSLSGTLALVAGGFAALVVGTALFLPVIVGPMANAAAVVVGRSSMGRIATRNIARVPTRSATTAAALMIGLCLATFAAVAFASFDRSITQQIDRAIGADITLSGARGGQAGATALPAEVLDEVRATDGVATAVGLRSGGYQLGRTYDRDRFPRQLVGVVPDQLDDALVLETVAGDTDRFDAGSFVASADLAETEKWTVGERVAFSFVTGERRRLRLAATFEAAGLADVLIARSTFDAVQPVNLRADGLGFVRVVDGASIERVGARIERRLERADLGFVQVQDSDALKAEVRSQLAQTLGLIGALLALSFAIALFGIANTLGLGILERLREIGLLRAVGATRGQVRRIVYREALVLALVGSVAGIVLGWLLGAALVFALRDEGLAFDPAPEWLVVVLVVGVLAGLLASLLPARRAARTDVLRAIASGD